MARVLVGILRRKPRKLPLEKDAEQLEVDVLVFSPKGIKSKSNRVHGFLYSKGRWSKVNSPFPAAVYNRIYTRKHKLATTLEAIIGKDKFFNHITWFDKWKIYSFLKAARISSLPETMLYSSKGIEEMLKRYDKLIVKPCRGQFGKDVYRIEYSDSSYRLYNNLDFLICTEATVAEFTSSIAHHFQDKRYIIQRFITFAQYNERAYDIRLYVQKGSRGTWSVTGGFCRVAVRGSFLTNYCSEIMSITKMVMVHQAFSAIQLRQMKRISLLAAKVIATKLGHVGEVCLDFCLDCNGLLWIVEVNGHTQKKLLSRLKDANLERVRYYYPLAYAKHLAIVDNAYAK